MIERDNCQFCLGKKGGVSGNENRINGIIACDHCAVLVHRASAPTSDLGGTACGSGDLGALSAEAVAAAYYDCMIGDPKEFWPHHDGWAGKSEAFKAKVRDRMAKALKIAALSAPTPDLGAQGEPVAWAFEWMSRGGWVEGISRTHPGSLGTRNVKPLFKQDPAAPRLAVGRVALEWAHRAVEAYWTHNGECLADRLLPETREAMAVAVHGAIRAVAADPRDDTRAGGAEAQEGGR